MGVKYCMGRVCRIRRIVIEYSSAGQPDGVSNIVWVMFVGLGGLWIEYSFAVYIGQPDGVSNIVSVVLSD